MPRFLGLKLGFVLLVGCVANNPIVDNQPCPCAPGCVCDAARDVCVRGHGGSGGAGGAGGQGGFTGGDGGYGGGGSRA